MFSIYDINGRQFRNTLEKLRQVRNAQNRNLNSHASKSEDDAMRGSDLLPDTQDELIVSNSAVQAYRNIRHLSQREPVYHAYQVMSHSVRTVSTDMGIIDAHRYFQEHGYQQMPVVGPQQKIVGMLTIKDLMQFILIDGDQTHYISGKRVKDVISTEVVTADPVSDIRRVAQMMQEYHISAAPIVNDQDALVGIVSRGDILRAIMNDPPLNIWS